MPNQSHTSKLHVRWHQHILKHSNSQHCINEMKHLLKERKGDTEAGLLLGISQKHNMCSSPCRLTEFCNSQCLSHFAAPFIVTRTETSIAENCKLFIGIITIKIQFQIRCAESCGTGSAQVYASSCPTQVPMSTAMGYPNEHPKQFHQKNPKMILNMCE